ncbi:MAG: alpha/beta hydrolase, partial [Rudanella sp.]|nr:alpha/beta hydrolase [Rudanella sp.]
GFGDSPVPADNDYSVDAMTDDVVRLMDEHDGPFVVVGHSMSGKVALNLASRQPDGLLGLVLLAPSPPSPEPMDEAERQRLLTTHGQRSEAEETLKKITAASISDVFQELIVTDDLRSSPAAWTTWLEHGSCEDISDRMPWVQVPIQIVLGSEDDHINAELMQKTVLNHFPDAQITILEGAAHVLPLEKPAEVARVVDTFATWLLSKLTSIPSGATKPMPPAN